MSGTAISCSFCKQTFTARRNLYRHQRRFHPIENIQLKRNKQTMTCCICDNEFRFMKDLHSHIKSVHTDINLVFEEKKFYSDEDFLKWKDETEKEAKCHFSKHFGETHLVSGKASNIYYCHRSGTYLTKDNRVRRLKCIGTQKFGKTCPAYIMAYKQTVDDITEIEVFYQSIHIGHKCEIGRVPLSYGEKTQLAAQMKLGVPKSTVLSKLIQSYSPTKRLSLTNQKDLHNICRDFQIDDQVCFHKDDAISVDTRIRRMQDDPGNPVLIYKPFTEILDNYPSVNKNEFLLGIMNEAQIKLLEIYGNDAVMIDSTHGTNQYGFQLTTLMINDDNHEGFPIAILYSSKVNSECLYPFFMEIKKRCPTVKPRVFMSDDDPAFYNAFIRVYGKVEYRLLCSWHVRRAWNSNLNQKIGDLEIRENVKKQLIEICEESDLRTFQKISEEFVGKLLQCDSTKAFGEYLNTYYMNRVEQWAYSYRLKSKINTNMKVERWHRQLKYEEAGGKGIKRLDKSLSIVLNAISKKIIGRIVALERSKLTPRLMEIRKRHDLAKTLPAESIIEMEYGKLWTVFSSKAQTSTSELMTYNVQYEKECSCEIKCIDCNVCIHNFSCTCHDYTIRFTICKHIHLICQHFSSQSTKISDDDTVADLTMDIDDRQEENLALSYELKKQSINYIDKNKSILYTKLQSAREELI